MADEPMLCFDGDKAGRRAAYRAVDLALPKLAPGKSLRFAMLPEGQDPDDLIRSGGRDAMAEVLKSARPLADMLWMRETESASFDTPERRAALEARIGEILRGIGHETVRKYYRQDFEARVRALFAPAQPAGGFERGRGFERDGRRGGGRAATGASAQRPAREPFGPARARLGQSPLVRGSRSAISAARGADPALGDPASLAAREPMPRNSPSSNSSIRTPISCAARSWMPAPARPCSIRRRCRAALSARGSTRCWRGCGPPSPTPRTGRPGPGAGEGGRRAMVDPRRYLASQGAHAK